MALLPDTSMVPLILPSDKPLVRKAKNYKLNDIVVFKKDDRLVAHRIVFVYPDGYFQIKGDNNLTSDGRITKSRMLGRVDKVLRGGQRLSLSHVYLSQSSTYLQELNSLNKAMRNAKIAYVMLKGLPLHLAHGGRLPRRLYLDADILIKRKDYPRVEKIFLRAGFEPVRPKLLGRTVRSFSQISFVKKVEPFAVIFDLHFAPAVGFTKATGLNKLIPSLSRYTNGLFEAVKEVGVEGALYPLLAGEDLVLYLLLHLSHHNYQGIHRMELIDRLIRTTKPDMEIVVNKAKKYGFEYFIYPSLFTINKFFGAITLPENLKIPYPVRLISKLVLNSSPFDEDRKAVEGAKRFIFTFFLSRASLIIKLSVLFSKDIPGYFFPTIKSAFFRT